MSVDLGAFLDAAAPLVASAITTSGTEITFTRPGADEAVTVDPATLAVTDTATRVLTAIPAIVQAVDATGQPLGPGRTWQATGYRVLLLPGVTDLLPGDRGTVVQSRDRQLLDVVLVVDEIRADTPGVVRIALCHKTGAGA